MAVYRATFDDNNLNVSITVLGGSAEDVHAAMIVVAPEYAEEANYSVMYGNTVSLVAGGLEVDYHVVPRLVILGILAGYITSVFAGSPITGVISGAIGSIVGYYLIRYFPV